MGATLDGVVQQMLAAGLPPISPQDLKLDTGRWVRYGPGRKAFYKLFGYTAKSGEQMVSYGTFGVGGDGPWKVEPESSVRERLSAEEWSTLKREREAKQREEAARIADEAHRAANRARDQWNKSQPEGASAYLVRKQVARAEGVRFMSLPGWQGWIILLLYHYGRGAGEVVGSQKIAGERQPDGGDKRFNKGMAMDGAALLLGDMPVDGDPILIAEGYATCASVREGLGYRHPVVMACNAGNLGHVAAIFRARFPKSPIVFLADDDYLPRKDGTPNHTGRLKADLAAVAVGNARVVLPRFSVPRRATREDSVLPQLTDYNDLHVHEGLEQLRTQLLEVIQGLPAEPAALPPSPSFVDDGPGPESAPPTPSAEAGAPVGADTDKGAGEEVASIWPERLLRHYALIVGKNRFWCDLNKTEMGRPALVALVGDRKLVDAWLARDDKRTILAADVARLKGEKEAAEQGESLQFGEFMARYVYLDGSDSIWDAKLLKVISNSALKLALGDWYKTWVNSPRRRVLPFEHLVFDPTQRVNPETHINLFRGLPLTPAFPPGIERYADPFEAWGKFSGCEAIIGLLAWLCNHRVEVINWILCWLAYPLQHVGAKLDTAILMHGDVHGSGKSLFFERVIKPIYGEYASTLSQHQLDSQYTGWRSRKLFCLFEEVLSSNQRYSHTGTLKQMVTGKTHMIEKKFVDAWEEENHMNGVFLSNSVQPFHVERGDRRFLVVWPAEKFTEELQAKVEYELARGGVQAFYAFLLAHPLTCCKVDQFGELVDADGAALAEGATPVRVPFTPHSKPMMTPEKARVISYGLSGWELFLRDWQAGEIGGERLEDRLPYCSCTARDLGLAYAYWCSQSGEREMPPNKFSEIMSAKIPRAARWFVMPGTKERRQLTVFKIGRRPEGVAEEVWLGQDIVNFRVKAGAWGVDFGN